MSSILKQKGCDVIIALTHMRVPNDRILAQQCQGDIDLILGGHDHSQVCETIGLVTLVKSGSDFEEFSSLSYDVDSKRLTDYTRVQITSEFEPDKQIEQHIAFFTESLNQKLQAKCGYTAVDLDGRFAQLRTKETNLANLIADMTISAFTECDVVLINSGALRINMVIPKGDLTIRDITMLLPITDSIVLMEMPGDVLWRALENAVSQYPKNEGRFQCVSGIRF